MLHREDSELTISAWSPDWIGGFGVAKVTEVLVRDPPNWELAETASIPARNVNDMFGSVRYCGHAVKHNDGQLHHPGFVPVVCDLSRLKNGKKGPRLQCIVSHAPSTVDCPIGLHSIDMVRPVPEEAFKAVLGRRPHECTREVLSAFRHLCDRLRPTWAACLTFGRGPSIAELYRQVESRSLFGVVYLSQGASSRLITQLRDKAPVSESPSGFELTLSPVFGAPAGIDQIETFPLIFAAMRQASLPLVPWEMLSRLDER